MVAGGVGLALCTPVASGLSGQLQSQIGYQLFYADPPLLALEWMVMVLAMMLPLALPHVALFVERLYRRDQRASLIAALSGYLAAWALLGLVAIPLMLFLRALAGLVGPLVPLAAYLVAIAWAWSPLRIKAFRRCHALPYPNATGWALCRVSALYGARLGCYCVTTCGFAMIAPMLSGQGPVAMFILTHVLLSERLMHKPRPIHTALPLTGLGVLALLQTAV